MQMKHLLLLASLLTCMGSGAQQATFRNPVIAGDMADPTVIRVDNTYYATGTSSESGPLLPAVPLQRPGQLAADRAPVRAAARMDEIPRFWGPRTFTLPTEPNETKLRTYLLDVRT